MIVIDQIKINHINATDGDGFNFIPVAVNVAVKLIRNETMIPASVEIDFEIYKPMDFAQLENYCTKEIIQTINSER